MRIYSMTATFGKLEHETLTLKPGLNIIEAPNEWGKSTWCTFLVTMLYGLDTREKTTKNSVAVKERYAPWSGSPMAGRIDLEWNGRDITIERSTKGRTPLGVFRAYETESGIVVPELTAANCGQMLLGVERNVFTRAGFLRFSDLPVTNDDALRHRLNALVTTGDESSSAETLGQKLRDLKNRCRYNRSGLLPQAEMQRDQLQAKLQEHRSITDQAERLRSRHADLEQHIAKLENHKAALRYAAAKDDEMQVQAAVVSAEQAAQRQKTLEAQCSSLPSRETAEQAIQNLTQLRRAWDSIQMEEQMLPPMPHEPETPEYFRGLTPDAAVAQAEADRAEMNRLQPPKGNLLPGFILVGILTLLFAIGSLLFDQYVFAILGFCTAICAFVSGFVIHKKYKTKLAQFHAQQTALCRRYGSNDPDEWVRSTQNHRNQWTDYQRRLSACRRLRGDLDSRREALTQEINNLSGSRGLSDNLEYWQQVIGVWDAYADARRGMQQTEKHLHALQAMAKTAHPPAEPDDLTFTEAETNRLLSDATFELRQLHQKLGQCQGQTNALGDGVALQRELESVNRRIEELELTYKALEYAQKALADASTELQRRFAPQISKRAEALFAQLTNGRYDRLTLAEDLSLYAGALGEDTLHAHQWRSDGTIDQLYLALRLAVAESLTPDAPLILDDALVRFDDTRLRAALNILRQEAKDKQILLFTCQGRENKLV